MTGFVVTILVLAALGYGVYLILRLASPATAAHVRDILTGWFNRPASPTR